ncbi:MAG: NADH-ubiquinone oxidoreductase chain N, partial [uncultured Gemmatimonadetes bacterium]
VCRSFPGARPPGRAEPGGPVALLLGDAPGDRAGAGRHGRADGGRVPEGEPLGGVAPQRGVALHRLAGAGSGGQPGAGGSLRPLAQRDGGGGPLPADHQLHLPGIGGAGPLPLHGVPGPARHQSRRVPRAGALRHRGDDADGRGPRPDAAVRGAGGDVAGHLRAGGLRPDGPALVRGVAQVLPAGRLLQRVLFVRPGAGVGHGGHHQPPRDRAGGHRGRGAVRGRLPGGDGAHPGGLRLQGGGDALPHVDAGRVRRRAHARDGADVHRGQGGGVRGLHPRVRGGLRGDERAVADLGGGDRHADHVRGQPGRAHRGERQADAGVLLHRARGVPAGGPQLQHPGRGGGLPVLPGGVHHHDGGRLRRGDRQLARGRRGAGGAGGLGGLRFAEAVAGGLLLHLPPVAGGLPAHGRLPGEDVHPARGAGRGAGAGGGAAGACFADLVLLLPARDRGDVHAPRALGRRPPAHLASRAHALGGGGGGGAGDRPLLPRLGAAALGPRRGGDAVAGPAGHGGGAAGPGGAGFHPPV